MLPEIILAASLLGFFFLLIVFKWLGIRERKKGNTVASKLLPKEKKFHKKYSAFFQRSYSKLSKVPLLQGYIKRIRFRIEIVNQYDEYQLRRETMKIVFASLAISTFVILVFAAFNPNILFIFIILLAVIFINGIVIDLFINRLEDRLLRQFKDFIEDVRHYYNQTKMIDEAVYSATQLTGPEAKIQGLRIQNILTSDDPEAALQKYESVAPNRFLKIFASIAVFVQESGDIVNEKGSVFLNGLAVLTKETNYEILRRDKLSYVLKGLSVIAVMPIMFIYPLRHWVTTFFPALEAFYESRTGIFIHMSLYFIILASFLLIRKLREIQEPRYISTSKKLRWEEKIYKNRLIKKLIDSIKPGRNQKEYFRLTLLLKQANSSLTMEWLYIHRLLAGLITAAIVLSFFIFSHYSTIQNVLYSPTYNYAFGQVSDEDRSEAMLVTEFDREIYMNFKEVKEKNHEKILNFLSEEHGMDKNARATILIADRIVDKLETIDNSYLKWWEVLVSILIAIIAYRVPVWILNFQVFFRKKDMEDEVNQFYTIIGIVSQFKNVSVEIILLWMAKTAVTFKDPINTCLLNYDSGQGEALDKLKEEVSFTPFGRLVDRLKLSLSKISIKEAFDDLELEKEYFLEKRNQHNEAVINDKAWWGSIIGFAPTWALLLLYLIFPLCYIAITETNKMFQSL
ncbi:hypothetical protein [Cytobacillus purgationiresistens]|uniref:MFS family permease n=1 Tax=Cytobacillus purgationiresistens TaxID=863449 RepID=A0ABU0AJK5_9BACI|nr:hypothetical protein [Cytobacillus purgationiresistens]MDQ0271215.1 MFS family permease [Cytobacillus purgationiresistens]